MDESLPTDLNLFEGMEGFEKFNPMDDSSLTAILDDLEEGTLLSLLGDETLLNDETGAVNPVNTMEYTDFPIMDFLNDTREHPQCDVIGGISHSVEPAQISGPLTGTLSSHTNRTETDKVLTSSISKRPLQEPSQVTSNPLKRARLDSPVVDTDHILSCIQHDHSYATSHRRGSSEDVERVSKEPRSPVGSSSDEEGSLSDAGTGECVCGCICNVPMFCYVCCAVHVGSLLSVFNVLCTLYNTLCRL